MATRFFYAYEPRGYMVQLFILVFFGLFAAAETYQSVKNVQLPMPVYLVLGILLAVASNARSYLARENSEAFQVPNMPACIDNQSQSYTNPDALDQTPTLVQIEVNQQGDEIKKLGKADRHQQQIE
jgi:hypothetical protein